MRKCAIASMTAVLAAGLFAGGCIKIHQTVKLNEDGSGQVIEELIFGEKLVNVSKRMNADGPAKAPTVETLTSKQRVEERMANMGEGVSLVSHELADLPDGSKKMVTTFAFKDISKLKLAPVPFGKGWEDVTLNFALTDATNLAGQYRLDARLTNGGNRPGSEPEKPLLNELEAQQVRLLLPVFKDLLEGFELSLRLEVYDPSQWATLTRGFGSSQSYDMSRAGGRLTFYKITDQQLFASDDGLLMVVPWRQIGREFDLYHHGYPAGPRIMPYVNYIQGDRFSFLWRVIQTPHGREYY